MLEQYKTISIVYGGSGRDCAQALHELIVSKAEQNRYPLSSCIVLESILTHDLLDSVASLFRRCDFCVAILTADDLAMVNGKHVRRLRQNVVFELGMALYQLGRDRVILISDFDPRDPAIELPSDISELAVKQFTQSTRQEVLDAVVDKLLCQSQEYEMAAGKPAHYGQLLQRTSYHVDYQRILTRTVDFMQLEGNAFLQALLKQWYTECRSFRHYDERCLYFFERIGFLPVFGNHDWVMEWYDQCQELLSSYTQTDIDYCGRQPLHLLHNLVQTVIGYTRLKSNRESHINCNDLECLMDELSDCAPEDCGVVNPLVSTLYYDYLGLIAMRLYRETGEADWLDQALNAFTRITEEFADKVDMSLNIWSGFVRFNLARAYTQRNLPGDTQLAINEFRAAVRLRRSWLKAPHMHATVRSVLSYEYFICRLKQIEAERKFATASADRLLSECSRLQAELDAYKSADEQLERLDFVQRLLKEETTTLQSAGSAADALLSGGDVS